MAKEKLYEVPTKIQIRGFGNGSRTITIPAFIFHNKNYKFPIKETDFLVFEIYEDKVVIKSADK